MADLYLGESAAAEGDSGSGFMGAVFNWAGASMSVALVGGLCMWGYDLAMRDVAGVPVVRALEGPMRITPEDPGGDQAEYQGFAVNSVAADGAASGPVDRLTLAPPPDELTEEDLPAPVLADGGGADADEGPDLTEADVLALADRLAEDAMPLAEDAVPLAATPDLAEDDATVPEISSEAIPETVRGVSRSPFPVVRPRAGAEPPRDVVAEEIASAIDLSASRGEVEAVTPVTAGGIEVDPADVVAGSRLVQFGAFASVEEARAEWDRLDERFTDFFVGKQRVIEKAVSGGKTFYRLRAMGFTDISDARRFCSAFVADRQACIPVVAR